MLHWVDDTTPITTCIQIVAPSASLEAARVVLAFSQAGRDLSWQDLVDIDHAVFI